MFAAGLGAGLLFYGIAEPVSHWTAPPHGLAEPESEAAALVALRYTYFHWGFNGWAMYAVMGGAMAYFSFRKGLPVAGERDLHARPRARRHQQADRPARRRARDRGHALRHRHRPRAQRAAAQQRAGLPVRRAQVERRRRHHHRRRHAASSSSRRPPGVEKGINFLANLGSFATIGLFLFFLVVGGSTVLVISQGIESIGTYVLQVLPMSLQTGVGDEQWMAGWTIFYWAWWVSWAPFVGHVRRPHLARPHDPRVRDRRRRRADRVRLPVVRRRRRHRHRAAAQRRRRHRRLARHPRAVALHRARRAAPSRDQLRPVHPADRPLLHQRRRRGLRGDGDDGLARLDQARPSSSSSCSAC